MNTVMKHQWIGYTFLALLGINIFFLLQIVFTALLQYAYIIQWFLLIANSALFIGSLFAISRKEPEHHSRHELTIFQALYFLLMCAMCVMLLVMLLILPTAFIIFMPFEFFVLCFYIGMYFLLSRHILPVKKSV